MQECICDDCGKIQEGEVGDRCSAIGPHPENGRHTGYLISYRRPKRGGARKGTGPKPGPGGRTIDKNASLTEDVWAFHAQNAASAAKSIEAMTRRNSAFKSWLKSQGSK